MKGSINIYADVEVLKKFKEKHKDNASAEVEKFMRQDINLSSDESNSEVLERYAEGFRRATATEQAECRMQWSFYKDMEKIPPEMGLSEYYVKFYMQGIKP